MPRLKRRVTIPSLFLQRRDRLDAATFSRGIIYFVARVKGFERWTLHFKLFDRAAAVRSDSAALRLLDCNRAIEPVNLGDHSRAGLLSQRRRHEDAAGRSTRQHDLCYSHRGLPISTSWHQEAMNGFGSGREREKHRLEV